MRTRKDLVQALGKLNIKVVDNKVKKSDVKKALAAQAEGKSKTLGSADSVGDLLTDLCEAYDDRDWSTVKRLIEDNVGLPVDRSTFEHYFGKYPSVQKLAPDAVDRMFKDWGSYCIGELECFKVDDTYYLDEYQLPIVEVMRSWFRKYAASLES